MGNNLRLRYECFRPTSCKFEMQSCNKAHRFLGSINDFLEIRVCLHGLGARKHDLSVSADGCQIINEPVGNFFGALKLIHKFLSQCFKSTLLITDFRHFLPAPF
jgi:hypothetical protein